MTQTVPQALQDFSLRYQQAWQDKHNELPRSEELADLVSPCVEEKRDEVVLWKSVPREEMADFTNVENLFTRVIVS